jgi:hypothetical protein
MTFNPPTTVEGRWIIQFFAPWLDPRHPNPALPGELRWFTTVAGKDTEVPDSRPFVLRDDGERVYDYDPKTKPEDILVPKSRTFIPSRVTDNPYYMATGYISTLQAMPEPLRSQMLYGDFRAGVEDDQFQVIPTRWVEQAMERWKQPERLEVMDSLGMDVAMGGRDRTILMARHGRWYGMPIVYPGKDCPDGPTVAGYTVAAMRNLAVIHLDLFGVGAKVYGPLMEMQLQVIGVSFGDKCDSTDATGHFRFPNLRSYLWWRMRELLDPDANNGICLPPDRMLLADLTAPKWKPLGNRIVVQSRDEIIETIGRSPDYGTACILASMDTPKRQVLRDALGRAMRQGSPAGHDPYSVLPQEHMRGHDPYA